MILIVSNLSSQYEASNNAVNVNKSEFSDMDFKLFEGRKGVSVWLMVVAN